MGRICAVIDCGNSTYTLERWKQTVCELHGCRYASGECDCPKPFKLFTFPISVSGTTTWARLINRTVKTAKGGMVKNWVPNKDSRVCSKHFKDLEPTDVNPNPTLHLGYKLQQEKKTRPPPKLRSSVPIPSNEKGEEIVCPVPMEGDHESYTFKCRCQADCSREGCILKNAELKKLEHELECVKEGNAARRTKKTSLCAKYLTSDKKTRLYTGLPDEITFDGLYQHLQPKVGKMRYWLGTKKVASTRVKRRFTKSPHKSGPRRKLSHEDELLVVLMKLRLGVTNQLLADMCGIALSTCSNIFNMWIKMLAVELKPLIYWPDKVTVQSFMPRSLAVQYPRLRCTLDCTEFFIERPRHLQLQALTWSDYKKHNTAKVLVAIAPNGMISFLSKAWGGRTSDKHLTEHSGFLNLIDPMDVILADRGFTIQSELLMKKATLFIPPPSSGLEQQSRADIMKTKKIANARIHVERAIGRMKWFTILKNVIPISLVPLIDDIVVVCAALCNLLPNLVQ